MSIAVRTALFLTAILALAVGAPASAQSADETADFRQITIRIPGDAAPSQKAEREAAFTAATQAITACDQVDAVARRVQGEVVTAEKFSLRNMPPQLAAQFAGKPAGTVSKIFGENGEFRVVIRC